MIVNPLFSNILSAKWLIEPIFAESQGAMLASMLNKSMAYEDREPEEDSAYAIAPGAVTKGVRYSYWRGFDNAPHGSVAVVRVNGTMMKYDQACGPIGTETIAQIIKEADAHENIGAIVLHIDSPGGTVDGTEVLGSAIKATEKPIISYVDGMMCSAALWAGVCSDEIIASTDTDEIGSVGVLLSFADVQPYWEKAGIKFHTIIASKSPEKVKVWEDLRAGKYDEYRKSHLDPIDEKFMSHVRAMRPNVTDDHLNGKVFFAKDVMGVFVDAIGTLQDAIEKAKSLSVTNGEETPVVENDDTDESANNPNSNNMKQYANLNRALGVESLEALDGFASLSEEQLAALDASIALGNTATSNLEAEVAAHATTKTELSTAQATIATQVTEIAGLKGESAGKPPVAKTKSDDEAKGGADGPVAKGEDLSADIDAVRNEYF